MHPRLQTRRARSAVMPVAVAFSALDSIVLFGLSSLLAALGLWR